MMSWIKYILILVTLLLSVGCGQEYSKLKGSVRKTQSEARLYQRAAAKIDKLAGPMVAGAAGQKGVEASSDSLNAYAPIEQKNMLSRYGYLYDRLNAEQEPLKADNFYWDSVQKIYYVKSEGSKRIRPENEVFGWHPYWMGSSWESYPFKLLSTISYFSYVVDPNTGSYSNPPQMEEWRTTAMVDSAKASGTRVLLTVANLGADENKRFLERPIKWYTLTDSLNVLLQTRDADGVDINFEEVPSKNSNDFVQFVEHVYNNVQLDGGDKPFVSLTLPAVNFGEAYNLTELEPYVDLFVIMGYNYFGPDQPTGAVSPLVNKNGGYSLERTILDYKAQNIPIEKTILALPYYGVTWEGKLNGDGVYESRIKRKVTYREVQRLFKNTDSLNYTSNLDRDALTNYFYFEYADGTSLECWYDDEYTLSKKYNLALTEGFKGVGIWALGYDNGYNNLWNLIDEKFATDIVAITNPIAEAEGYPLKLSRFLIQYKTIVFITFSFLFIGGIIGFIIVLSDWEVRNSMYGDRVKQAVLLAILIGVLVPLISLFDNSFLPVNSWKLYISFILGAFVFYVLRKLVSWFKVEQP